MAITTQEIRTALSTVQDPDLGKDLVSLNMIRDLKADGKNISFTIMLTTPACPLKDKLKQDCIDAIKKLDSSVEPDISFNSNVTTQRKTKEEMLPGVKNIIAVASGKGGVGKSTIAAKLALGLASNGASVGLMDADIYGPSLPTMLGMEGRRPKVEKIEDKHYIFPIEKEGLKVLSIGFLVSEEQPVVWRGPMVSSALRQFVTDCKWGDLDYMIIDLPPGTGDIHLTLVQTIPLTGAIIVTTPQNISMADARKAAGMFNMPQINIPILGVVENMAWFTPEELPDNKYYVFGKNGGKILADELDVPLISQVPLIQSVQKNSDSGEINKPEKNSQSGKVFLNLAEETARQVAIRNARKAPEQVVQST